MRIPYTVESFIDSSLFKNNLHKIKLMAFLETKTCGVTFTDLYIKSFNKYFMICSGINNKTKEQNIEIFELSDIWDFRLFNFLAGEKKVYEVNYYIPKIDMEIVVDEKEKDFLKSNAFLLSKNHINIDVHKKDFIKTNSIQFVNKYFCDNKDLNLVIFRINENDKFTKQIHTKELK